jgi:hypothetical protein
MGIATCASGSTVKESRPVAGDFRKISSTSGIAVYFSQGKTASIIVEAEPDIINEVKTEIKSGTLEIGFKGTSIFRKISSKITVTVVAPALDEVNATGGSNFNTDELSGSSIDFNLSGGARGNIGEVKLSSTLKINVSGGAACLLKNAQTSDCEFNSSGGARIEVKLESAKNVKANSSGGARIKLEGEARNVDANASGGASVDISAIKSENVNSNSSGGGRVHR